MLRGEEETKRHTHFNVEANRFRQLSEHLFQRRKRRLNKIPSTVTLVTLLFHCTGVFHSFAHLAYRFEIGAAGGVGALLASAESA